MVLRIKERKEYIQLLAMDPQVCGKLLTLHQKGNRVDVEALRDQIPSGRVPEKVPRWISWVQKVAAVQTCFCGCFWWFRNICEYIGGRTRSAGHEGPTRQGVCPAAWARPPPLSSPRGSSDLNSKYPRCLVVQEKSSKSFVPFGLRLVFIFCKEKNKGKNSKWHQALGQ